MCNPSGVKRAISIMDFVDRAAKRRRPLVAIDQHTSKIEGVVATTLSSAVLQQKNFLCSVSKADSPSRASAPVVVYHEEKPWAVTLAEFQRLHAKYHVIFTSPLLIEISDNWIRQGSEVEMGDYRISENGLPLFTTGVATCFAVCAKGFTAEGNMILGLMHASVLETITALEDLRYGLTQAGCIEDEFYILGGIGGSNHSCVEDEVEFLSSFERGEFNIKAVRFNLLPDEEAEEHSYDVILTVCGIYYSKH